MSSELFGDKIFNYSYNILKKLKLDNEKYIKRLQFECDSIDFYAARYPSKYEEIREFMKENRGKKFDNNKFNSLLYFLLDIYTEDPVKNNKELEIIADGDVDLVDIDQDVCRLGRDKIIEYIYSKFGEDKVKQIVVYQLAKTRAVIQDVAGVLGVLPSETFAMTKSLSASDDFENKTIDELKNDFSKLNDYMKKYPEVDKYCQIIRGMLRNYGKHPAGIVISSENLDDNIGLLRVNDTIITSWEEGTGTYGLKHMGYVKFDILGLLNVTISNAALLLINSRHNLNMQYSDIPLDDEKTFKLFQNAESDMIFQFDSNTAKSILRIFRPDRFEDISAANAILRPGPLTAGMDKEYAIRKHTGDYERYPEPINSVLEPTYNIIAYQEQIMQLAVISGFTDSESNKFRKVLVKYRDWESMEQRQEKIGKYRDKFINGLSKYISMEKSIELFELCAKFASYGFNKAHSVAYSLLSYYEAYFKANYPLEYAVAVLDNIDNPDKFLYYVGIVNSMGIKVNNPNINFPSKNFSIVDDKSIVLGFNHIKRINNEDIDCICNNYPYNNLDDFIEKTGIKNKSKIESLIFSNAFSDFGSEQLIYNYFHKNRLSKKKQLDYVDVVFDEKQMRKLERDSMSINIKYTINQKLKELINQPDLQFIVLPSEYINIEDENKPRNITIIGVISNYVTKISKSSKKPMGIATITDDSGSLSFFVWQNSLDRFVVKEDDIVVVNLNRFEDGDSLFLNRILLLGG